MTPASGSTGVGPGTKVTATFSEPLLASSVGPATVRLRTASGAAVSAGVAYAAGTRTATLTPSAPLTAGALYTATVQGVQDAAGNAMASAFSWSFTVAPAAPPSGGPQPGSEPGDLPVDQRPGSGGSGGGVLGDTSDRVAPRVGIGPATAKVSRAGAFKLRVSCPSGELRCRAAIRLRFAGRDAAERTVTVTGGRSRRFRLELSQRARRALARKGSIRVTARVAASDSAGNRRTTRTRIRLIPVLRTDPHDHRYTGRHHSYGRRHDPQDPDRDVARGRDRVVWTQAAPAQVPAPPGGPVLVVTDPADQFGQYYGEILRAEGLNEFAVANVGALNAQTLAAYQVVVLAATALTGAQVSRPHRLGQRRRQPDRDAARREPRRAPRAGQRHRRPGRRLPAAAAAPGGITGDDAVPRHRGPLDARRRDAGRDAVREREHGGGHRRSRCATVGAGQAAAFTYDLARSVVYTRQGNPAWAGRTATAPARSVRRPVLRHGQPAGWTATRSHIPQADEQQRLLANLITRMNLDRAPLPRFWYLPRGLKAAVVMTGDDHGTGGTDEQFDSSRRTAQRIAPSRTGSACAATSYVYPSTSVPGRRRLPGERVRACAASQHELRQSVETALFKACGRIS